ncbi:hypothetical protein Ga0061067_10463 [Pannonibacter indicus]|uniref:Uncharacterized protein n=1 Tax=Pannonibacter indicus TaxID=466044 RepID=A0A0K6HXR4_9HYPH|nr:hypothetical protein Ga0061067_10463 [Pannonibacter indicus]
MRVKAAFCIWLGRPLPPSGLSLRARCGAGAAFLRWLQKSFPQVRFIPEDQNASLTLQHVSPAGDPIAKQQDPRGKKVIFSRCWPHAQRFIMKFTRSLPRLAALAFTSALVAAAPAQADTVSLNLQSAWPLTMPASRNTAWDLPCAPSASPAPASRPAWRTWPVTSSASPGSRGVLCTHDAESRPSGRPSPESQQIRRLKRSPTAPSRAIASKSCRYQTVLRAVQLRPSSGQVP